MIPIDQMDDDIAYHMALDAGFDPEEYLGRVIIERQEGLRHEIDEVVQQLWANAQQVMHVLQDLLQDMRANDPYRAARQQEENLLQTAKELQAHKQHTLKIVESVKVHFNECLMQQKSYQQKLQALRMAYKKKANHDPVMALVTEYGERWQASIATHSTGRAYTLQAKSGRRNTTFK